MTRVVKFENGFSIRLAGAGRRFSGIGEVRFGRMRLRNPQLPWTVYTESESGVRFDEFELKDLRIAGDGAATIVFSSVGRWLPRVQDADSMGDARIKTRRLAAATATFKWTFRPVTETIADNVWQGLAMQIEVESPGNPIHWLIEDSTWEIGGKASGCTLIQRDTSAMDLEQVVEAGSQLSTIEKFYTDSGKTIYPMDMMPRVAGSSIFDFQVKGGTALCLFSEKPGLSRARIDKFADEDVIHYIERPFFLLTENARAPERKLMVCTRKRAYKRHEWRNIWIDCCIEVRRRIASEYGFQSEIPMPEVHVHLWDPELKTFGPRWIEPLYDALPEYRRLGYKDIFTHGVWESVTSDDTPGIEGNICGPYAFRYSEKFGGAAVMKRLADRAHELGLALFQWFGFQFAKYAPVWKEHPDWLLREANGDPWDGAYQILWCGRMRSGFGAQMLEQIKKVRDQVGLDGIFWDSYHNLGLTCVDWQAPDKAPQADAIWRMQTELQRYGYRQRCEATTVFGVSNVQIYGFSTDKFRRRLWADTVRNDDAFVLFDTSPAFYCESEGMKLTAEDYFWLLAHRAVPGMDAVPWGPPDFPSYRKQCLPGGPLAEEFGRSNRLYGAALPHMHRLRVTEGGKYTLWLDGKDRPSVIWAFRDTTIGFHGVVSEIESGKEVAAAGRLKILAGQVYLVKN